MARKLRKESWHPIQRPTNADDRIRLVFCKRRRFSRLSAARALGKSVRWVDKHRFSPENGGVVSWKEMVLMAYLLWTRARIHRALGEAVAAVFPPLAHLAPLTVQLPKFLIIAIRAEARRVGRDTSDIIADRITLWFDDAKLLEERHPGFLEAWDFPCDCRCEK